MGCAFVCVRVRVFCPISVSFFFFFFARLRDAEKRLRPSGSRPQINERDSAAETSLSIRAANRRWYTGTAAASPSSTSSRAARYTQARRTRQQPAPDESRNAPGRLGLPARGNRFEPINIWVVYYIRRIYQNKNNRVVNGLGRVVLFNTKIFINYVSIWIVL